MRTDILGSVFVVAVVPVGLAAFYIYSLRADLAASDRVIALERQARDDWQHKFEDLQKACAPAPTP